VFLTLTLATGIVFSETLPGRAMRFDHKTVFAVLSWITSRRCLPDDCCTDGAAAPRRWTLTGFVLLILAYVGSRFVLRGNLAGASGAPRRHSVQLAVRRACAMMIKGRRFPRSPRRP
jgi:hypothetical protein